MAAWDEAVDFLVAGSGAAGMTAALRAHDLGAATLVIEKAPVYGGSTALSGGVVWVPNNPFMRQHGLSDSPEEGLRYIEAVTAGSTGTQRLRAYIDGAPRMLATLAERSHVRFACLPDYPDYYPELAGGKPGGRSCEPLLFDALQLGEEFRRQRQAPLEKQVMGGRLAIGVADGHALLTGGLRAAVFMARGLLAYYTNLRARWRKLGNTDLTLGAALAGRLRLSLLERQVPLWLETPIKEILTEDGRVVGARVERAGQLLRIQARQGVLLAAGGFEHNAKMRQHYQPSPIGNQWTAGCDSNLGDTVVLGTAVGASLDLMDDAWWCPAMLSPASQTAPVYIVIFEKNLPGSIIVDARGRRFMNEAAPYNDVVKSMYKANATGAPAIPAFLIFDSRFRKKYPCGPMPPGYATPDRLLPKTLAGNFFVKADSIEALAHKIGVDADGLRETVARLKQSAAAGTDPDFHRGESLQDRYYTAKATGPNPNLGPIERPPFYAVRVYPGDLGTKGGFRTDAQARVLSVTGDVIPGLYAAGNSSATVMGRTYPGAGATIGPAMTFGFLAAEDAASTGRKPLPPDQAGNRL
ncbi:MAG: FAD-binding protein [Deltaproteobacteria bacterium]|nr:FAD-binding protein [Deltaproteobacteria bacterium]